MSDINCIFCKIIKGDIPAIKITETDHVLVFMDINPLSDGHCLFIPKIHAEKAHEVPDDALADILLIIKRVVSEMRISDYNILQNNGTIAHQVVPHAHWHLIPKPDRHHGLEIIWKPKNGKNQTKIGNELRKKLSNYK